MLVVVFRWSPDTTILDEADRSAGIISLNVGGNQWCEDDTLNLLDPRGHRASRS